MKSSTASLDFTRSLTGFRYGESLTHDDLQLKLGLDKATSAHMIAMIQDVASLKKEIYTRDWEAYEGVDVDSLTSSPGHLAVGEARPLLARMAVLKLNGGMGSSMGLNKPKSLLEVKQGTGQTFLSATVDYVGSLNEERGETVPLVLMNSPGTSRETKLALEKIDCGDVKVLQFEQRMFPRLNSSTLRPLPTSPLDDETRELWSPCGHGDVYTNLVSSGVAQQLVDMGKDFVLISNIDNLGATLEPWVVHHMLENELHFVLEATARTPNDTSGGLIVKNPNGKLELMETSQIPDKHSRHFDSHQFSTWNTNNLHIYLPALIEEMSDKWSLPPLVNVRYAGSTNALQLETAAGSALGNFKRVEVLAVNRRRFRIVKTTADVLLVRSNLFELTHGQFKLSRLRRGGNLPLVKWGEHFRTVAELEARVPDELDIIDLSHLTVEGDVTFGKGVKLSGTVIIIASPGESLVIPDGAVLKDNVISGSLVMAPY